MKITQAGFGLAEVMMGILCLVLVLVITAIAQPPNRWVEWFTGKHSEKKGDKR